MAKIHGLVYILVGLFISIASWKLNFYKLLLFFFVGIIFIIVGIVRLIDNFKEQTKNQEVLHKKSQLQKYPHQLHQYKRCNKCNNIMRINDRFCSKCGASV